MADKFDTYTAGLESPAAEVETVDISATDHTFANIPRGIYVGGAGTVIVDMKTSGDAKSFVGVQAGTILPIRPRRIIRTGTTATYILGLY